MEGETILATLIGGAVVLGGFALFFWIIIKLSTSSVKTAPYRPAPQPTLQPAAQPYARTVQEEARPRKKKQKNADAAPVRTTIEPLAPHVKTPEPEVATNTLAEEFDLRKAVIMAEILQPKYDE